jgi:hypothetical protein
MNQIGNQLIKDLQLGALSPEEQAAIVAQFSDALFQAVLVRGIESLTEPQKDALDAVLEKDPDGGPDVFMDFFMTNVPNFQVIVDEELKRIHDRAMAVVGGK